MSTKLSPAEALERIFRVIREEAVSNPTFARRLLDAAGVTVTFTGSDAVAAADPILVAARNKYDAFREVFLTFQESALKKMVTTYGLGTAEDVRRITTRPKKFGYIDLMWDGAQCLSRLGAGAATNRERRGLPGRGRCGAGQSFDRGGHRYRFSRRARRCACTIAEWQEPRAWGAAA